MASRVRASVGNVEALRRFLHATTLCAATSAASLFLVTGSALSPVQQGTREKFSSHRPFLEQAGPRKIGSTIYAGVNVVEFVERSFVLNTVGIETRSPAEGSKPAPCLVTPFLGTRRAWHKPWDAPSETTPLFGLRR